MSPSPWAGVNPSEWYDVRQWWHSHICVVILNRPLDSIVKADPLVATDCMNYNYHESLDTGSLLATHLPICQQVNTHECMYLFLVYFFYTIQLAMVWHGSLWLLAGLVIATFIRYGPSTQAGSLLYHSHITPWTTVLPSQVKEHTLAPYPALCTCRT